jgi:hypothetical protein
VQVYDNVRVHVVMKDHYVSSAAAASRFQPLMISVMSFCDLVSVLV